MRSPSAPVNGAVTLRRAVARLRLLGLCNGDDRVVQVRQFDAGKRQQTRETIGLGGAMPNWMQMGMGAALLLIGCETSEQAATRRDIAIAKQVIEEEIDTPSSAKYQSAVVVAKLDNRRIVHVVLDAQNKFGAMLRKSVCVN
jgi:hypothetical protein